MQKADGIEIDIRLTSDHHIVCHHDESTLRTTGIEKVIGETTLNELKKLDCGGWFGAAWKNERIPELKEVLRLLPINKELFIEVKTKEAIVPFLLKEIDDSHVDMNQITVISFYSKVIETIKKSVPQIKCNLLIAFEHKKIDMAKLSNLVKKIKADGVGAQNHQDLNGDLIKSLNKINKSVHVWTVNSRKQAELYLEKGIDSITTNKPIYIRNHLEKLNLS